MFLTLAIVLFALHFVLVVNYWDKLMGDDFPGMDQGWIWRWFFKGVAVPFAFWIVICLGWTPFAPDPQVMIPGPGRWGAVFDWSLSGLWVIGSYWGALTFGWLIAAQIPRIAKEHRGEAWTTLGWWTLWLGPVAGGIIWLAGWIAAGSALTIWLVPLAHGIIPLRRVPRKPQYAAALAKMNFGRYDAAEWEVIRQLETCENDFAGWLLLAELYATRFNDLPGAAQTIHDLCRQPGTTPSEVGVALHRLADWQLDLADDPVAARRTLGLLCERFPGTQLDRMARLRLERLPASRAELDAARHPGPLALPVAPAVVAFPEESLPRELAVAAAEDCVARLTRNPDDLAAREKFARLLAGPVGKVSLGVEQLELLLGMRGPAPGQRAAWLALLADWQLHRVRDNTTARRTLRRLVEEFRETPQAFVAQRELCRLEVEDAAARRQSARAPAVEPAAPSPPVAVFRLQPAPADRGPGTGPPAQSSSS